MGPFQAFFVLSTLVAKTFACNGYDVQDVKVSTCNNQDDVIGFDNFSAKLNDDCTVTPSGCIIMKKQVDAGNGTYNVERKAKMGTMPLKFGGKKDLCELLQKSNESPEVSLIFKMLNLGQSCPMKAGKICGNGNVSVGKYKDQLKLAEGEFVGNINGVTNAGGVCIQFSMAIAKKGAGGSAPSFPGMG